MRELAFSRAFLLLAALAVGCGSTSSGDGGTDASVADDDGGPSSGGGGSATDRDADVTAPTSCAELTCDAPATCDDAEGPPECFCPDGYDDVQGDGSLCRDVDECDEGTDDCAELETCVNEEGGFTCMGVNECARANMNDCDENATCTDEKEGFSCACNAPWTGDGTSCADCAGTPFGSPP